MFVRYQKKKQKKTYNVTHNVTTTEQITSQAYKVIAKPIKKVKWTIEKHQTSIYNVMEVHYNYYPKGNGNDYKRIPNSFRIKCLCT